MKHLLLALGLFSCFYLKGQGLRQSFTSAISTLSGCSAEFVDVFSGIANQASLSKLKAASIGVIGERRYGLAELNQYTLVAAMPAGEGVFGVQADYFGFSEYNENMLGIAYSRKIAPGVCVGFKGNFFSQNTQGYGKAAALNFEAGAMFQLTPELTTGLHIYNPLSSRLSGKGEERIPGIFKTNIAYQTSKNFLIGAAMIAEEDKSVDVQLGIIYRIHEKVDLRAGIATTSGNNYAGLAIRTGMLRIDLNVSYHARLGMSPALGMLYSFKKPEEN